MKTLVAFIYSLVLIVFASIVRGFALAILWRWFMVPFGLPALGIAWSIGVGLTLSYLLGIQSKNDAEPAKDMFAALVAATFTMVATPAGILLVGYIVHSYM